MSPAKRLAALVPLMAVVLSGCATAARDGMSSGGVATTGGSVRPLPVGSGPAAARSAPATGRPGGHQPTRTATAVAPSVPRTAAPSRDPAGQLLGPDDLGPGWAGGPLGDRDGGLDAGRNVYCRGQLATDRERVARVAARFDNRERAANLEQSVTVYDGSAESALAELASALRECSSYTTGTGADESRITIVTEPPRRPLGTRTEAAEITVTRAGIEFRSYLVVGRFGDRLVALTAVAATRETAMSVLDTAIEQATRLAG